MTRRNLERAVDGRQRQDALCRRLFGEDNAEPCAIVPRMAVRGVVHLKHDVGAGLDELPLSGPQNLRRLARRVADQKIAGERAGFRLVISVLTFGAVKKTPAGCPRNHFDFGSGMYAMR